QLSVLYRRMKRRCLVFESTGACLEQHSVENSGFDSPLFPQSNGNVFANQQLTQRQLLPGVGLQLNSVAAFASGRLLFGNSSSLSSVYPTDCTFLGTENVENHRDLSLGDPHEAIIPSSSNSPKRKRPRMEKSEEAGACKRCNCKKSKCLKLYCDCFAAGVYCAEPCACIGCFNKPAHDETVQATRRQIETRNPLAFAPKVIAPSTDSQSDAPEGSGKTPVSARHKRGCNCKRSGCNKKYCECYQSGVGCSINCRCESCRNAFGRKDGN
ncbi:hypothetical protein M569_04133, partial [Genlisea aurea]